MLGIHGLHEPASRYANSIEIASTVLRLASDLLKKEEHNQNFLDFIKSLREGAIPKKDALVILESHIRNLSFNDNWTMVLESLPAGSPINSLQTVSENISDLEKKN